MSIKIVKTPREWSRFINSQNPNTFLQSWGWKDFNEIFGHKTWMLGMYEDKKIVSAAMVLKVDAKRGKFLFVPQGPIGKCDKKTLKTWTKYLVKLAKKENCSFVRISPVLAENEQNLELFEMAGFINSPIHMHAELSTAVNLQPFEDEILIKMRKTTRQMIRKGQRLIDSGEVEIKFHKKITPELYEVYQSTTKRGKFVPFKLSYINQEYKSFSKYENCYIVSTNYQGSPLSWGLFIMTKKRAFYHQGANILHKKIPASYITHWQGMKLAKEKGCESYDFWGIAPKDQPKHPWSSISLFKRGFGGDETKLVPAQDYVINWKYWPTYWFEKYRAKKRGF